MKNRKKLAKGVIALSMALSFGIAILAPTHEAVASGGCIYWPATVWPDDCKCGGTATIPDCYIQMCD
jgi:hypothetical protein